MHLKHLLFARQVIGIKPSYLIMIIYTLLYDLMSYSGYPFVFGRESCLSAGI